MRIIPVGSEIPAAMTLGLLKDYLAKCES